jgi:hypothetical protein
LRVHYRTNSRMTPSGARRWNLIGNNRLCLRSKSGDSGHRITLPPKLEVCGRANIHHLEAEGPRQNRGPSKTQKAKSDSACLIADPGPRQPYGLAQPFRLILVVKPRSPTEIEYLRLETFRCRPGKSLMRLRKRNPIGVLGYDAPFLTKLMAAVSAFINRKRHHSRSSTMSARPAARNWSWYFGIKQCKPFNSSLTSFHEASWA